MWTTQWTLSKRTTRRLDDEDDFDFAERVQTLTAELEAQMRESVLLDKRIRDNLAKVDGVKKDNG